MATDHNREYLEEYDAEHRLDPNFPVDTLQRVEGVLDEKVDEKQELDEAELVQELEEDSPYPEVRSAVSPIDDPTLPVNTFRMWFLGIIFTIIGSGVNQFFSLRYPSVYISPLAAQLLSYPCGVFLAKVLPRGILNPGPFNMKEHTVIVVMANVSYGSAYATDILVTQIYFYGSNFGWGYNLLLTITTQTVGYGLAGSLRRWLVYPAAMIWPSNLVPCALFATLHKEESHKSQDGSLSRYRFFFIAFTAAFVWYWFPGFLFEALSYFNWVCWIAPNNIVVNQLFGVTSGLGMGILTFDWAQVGYALGSPLMTPWWTEVNVAAGFVVFFWIVAPAVYYTNTWNAQWFPILDSISYDDTGVEYNVSRIINPDLTFNATKYEAYSQLYLPTVFALSYGLSFAGLTSIIVHTWLYYRHDIVKQFKASLDEDDDIHRKLMRVYPEVPDWWYYVLFLISFGLSIFVVQYYPTDLPWWGLIVALIVAVVWTVPIGIIQAITNIQPGLNVITEFICGYMLPGRPIANICFKCYGYICMAQALSFTSDLKIGHYMKVPPRTLFVAQTIATILGAIVQTGVTVWMLEHINGICVESPFICPGGRVFFTASMIWGAIGPARMFGSNGIYSKLQIWFLVGAIAPIPFYYLAKRYPNSNWKYVNTPIFFGGTGNTPPATGINYTMYLVLGFIFQYVIRQRHFNWWSKYNYVLSAALDSGLAVSTIVIFFALEYYPVNVSWWGNEVMWLTRDGLGGATNALHPPTPVPDPFTLPVPITNGVCIGYNC